MQIEREQRGSIAVVRIKGPIILGESARQFTEYMDKLLSEEIKGVLIDLAKINYVDSTGLGELVAYMQIFNERGRTLSLLHPHEKIMALLRLTSLDKEFDIFDELDQALESLS